VGLRHKGHRHKSNLNLKSKTKQKDLHSIKWFEGFVLHYDSSTDLSKKDLYFSIELFIEKRNGERVPIGKK
jgi:hypothetical protein